MVGRCLCKLVLFELFRFFLQFLDLTFDAWHFSKLVIKTLIKSLYSR